MGVGVASGAGVASSVACGCGSVCVGVASDVGVASGVECGCGCSIGCGVWVCVWV